MAGQIGYEYGSPIIININKTDNQDIKKFSTAIKIPRANTNTLVAIFSFDSIDSVDRAINQKVSITSPIYGYFHIY